MRGTKNPHPKIRVPPKTKVVANVRFIFADNLSTTGLSEHDITNDAKNNIAMSLIWVINSRKSITTIKKIMFLGVIYFSENFSNIFITPYFFYSHYFNIK
jgi:hypothetical protein